MNNIFSSSANTNMNIICKKYSQKYSKTLVFATLWFKKEDKTIDKSHYHGGKRAQHYIMRECDMIHEMILDI